MTRMKRFRVQLQWEPRDLWVGIYWNARPLLLTVYICLVPCLPIRLQIWRGRL